MEAQLPHSCPRHYMIVSLKPRPLYPVEKPRVPNGHEAGLAARQVLTLWITEESLAPSGNQTLADQPLVRHYTN
jgi:hypothetical protein